MLDGKLGNASEVSVEGSKVDGKLYMVPESLKAVAMYYDKSKIATPPATTDELLAGGQGRHDQGRLRRPLLVPLVRLVGRLRRQADGRRRASASPTPPASADAYKYFQELQTAGATWYDKYDDLASDFKSGKIDLIVDGPWASGGYKEALKDNLAVAPMPAGPKGPSQPLTGVDGWYINTMPAGPRARGQLRPRDGEARERAGLRRHGGSHPGRHDDHDQRSDHPEVR